MRGQNVIFFLVTSYIFAPSPSQYCVILEKQLQFGVTNFLTFPAHKFCVYQNRRIVQKLQNCFSRRKNSEP